MEELGGSTQAAELFTRLVITGAEAPDMAARAAARGSYDALESAGEEWTPPFAVREAMAAWRFDEAEARIDAALSVLDARDRIASTVAPLDLSVPGGLEVAYEEGEGDLDEVDEMAGELLDAASALREASAAVEAERDPFETVGLLFAARRCRHGSGRGGVRRR